jgi:hypothetical protein
VTAKNNCFSKEGRSQFYVECGENSSKSFSLNVLNENPIPVTVKKLTLHRPTPCVKLLPLDNVVVQPNQSQDINFTCSFKQLDVYRCYLRVYFETEVKQKGMTAVLLQFDITNDVSKSSEPTSKYCPPLSLTEPSDAYRADIVPGHPLDE